MGLNRKQKEEIRSSILRPTQFTNTNTGEGVVLWYDASRNMATVLMSQPGSDLPGEVLRNVPCPVQIGVQGVGPEPGRACRIEYKNGNLAYPIVTSFFNYFYQDQDYGRQVNARQPLPKFILDM